MAWQITACRVQLDIEFGLTKVHVAMVSKYMCRIVMALRIYFCELSTNWNPKLKNVYISKLLKTKIKFTGVDTSALGATLTQLK